MEYSRDQIETLRDVRGIFAEAGFEIFDLKRRKHVLEFAAVKRDTFGLAINASGLVARLFRGRVRIQFFHSTSPIFILKRKLQERFGNVLYVTPKLFNPTYCGNYRTWNDVVALRQLQNFV